MSNFKNMVLKEKYLLEISQKATERKYPKIIKGEVNVLSSYFTELDRLLFKLYDDDIAKDITLRQKYLDKFYNTYEDMKKRVDSFLANTDQ